MEANDDQLSASVDAKNDVSTRRNFWDGQNVDVKIRNVGNFDDSIYDESTKSASLKSDQSVFVVAFVDEIFRRSHDRVDISGRIWHVDQRFGLNDRLLELGQFGEVVVGQSVVEGLQVDASQSEDLKSIKNKTLKSHLDISFNTTKFSIVLI